MAMIALWALVLTVAFLALWWRVHLLTRRLADLTRRLESVSSVHANGATIDASSSTTSPPPSVSTAATAAQPAPLATPHSRVPASAPVLAAPAADAAPAAGGPQPIPAGGTPAESWEVVVGSNWLNKIGVVVFVMGMALLVGYSVVHVGPLGRVLIGWAISAAMLAVGIAVERRPTYRAYAHGLIAGGWAGAYFTTYAMHAIAASRVITSDALGFAALLAVAAGMIAHSLRYRSETVTGLAYVTGYATLLLTPLSGFSLAASLPLSASLVAVAVRRRWTGVWMLGIVSTYVLLAWRIEAALAHRAPMPPGIWPALALLWIMFEGAELAAMARRRETTAQPPLFALNAMGALGAGLLIVPSDGPSALFKFLTAAGLAYTTSAVIRLWLTRGAVPYEQPARFGSAQAAVAIAAGLSAWAIDTRFSGLRETLVLLLEAQFLVVAGLLTADRYIRQTGAAVGLLVFAHHLDVPHDPSGQQSVVVSLLMMAAWYGNRESLRSRDITPWALERTFTWTALLVGGLLIDRHVPVMFQGLAGLLFAVALLDAGLRRSVEYRAQSYLATLMGAVSVLLHFGFTVIVPAPRLVWTVLPAATAASVFMAWRAARGVPDAKMSSPERRGAAALGSWCALSFVAVFEARTAPGGSLTLLWTATALAIVAAGAWRPSAGLRWQGYALNLVAFLRLFALLFDSRWPETVWLGAATIAAIYAATLVVRRGLAAAPLHDTGVQLERIGRVLVSITATLLLLVLIAGEVRASLLTLAWAVAGAGLLVSGFVVRDRVLRLSGLGLLLLCTLKLFVSDLSQLEALARILSFVLLGLVLLAISWAYTRFGDQIRRLL